MIGRMIIFLGLLLLAVGLAACGTIEVGLADDDGMEESAVSQDRSTDAIATSTSPPATPTRRAPDEATSTPTPITADATATVALVETDPSTAADWQQFYNDDYGIELWHPPGTTVVIGEPARPVFSSAEYAEGIVEEQVFVARVMQEEGAAFGPPGPQAILEIKLVTNPQSRRLAEMAELYSKRCPGPLQGPIQPTTINVQLSGYRYGCEGMDGIIFNEFWAPHPADAQLLFGAVWTDMASPLADEILATVAITD